MALSFPKHIAIIMDGNGRWARGRGALRIRGHEEGVNRVRDMVRACSARGVEILSLYAFSMENWDRPAHEVRLLMELLRKFAIRERQELCEQNVQLRLIGDVERIPSRALEELHKTCEATQGNDGLVLQLALSYGGRDEILRAVQRIQKAGVDAKNLNEDSFSEFLDTGGRPDPDLVIRTSGEQRLSNFLIWQAAYAEFYFADCYWPEFDEVELDKAIEAYQKRERRYGKVSDKDDVDLLVSGEASLR